MVVGSYTFYLPARWSEAGLVEFLVLCDSVGFLLENRVNLGIMETRAN